ncbi:aromatic-ring-hydroxylating dioxygenase subunit beta [Bordetella petrii]|nr:nuclear transport factor 2 family protein [Bordetella petrii]
MNEQLTLRLVVSDFLDRYVSALDQNRLESWADLFAEDALYEIVSKENCDAGLPIPLVRCKGARMVRDRVLSLRHANIYEMPVYRHLLSGLQCEVVDGTGPIDFSASFVVVNTTPVGETSIYLAGCYKARLSRVDDDLRIERMTAIYDTAKVPTLLAFPV